MSLALDEHEARRCEMASSDQTNDVQGRCPFCGHRSLFLGSGGYITCRIAECPNPTGVADLLDGESIDQAIDHGRRLVEAAISERGFQGCAVVHAEWTDNTDHGWLAVSTHPTPKATSLLASMLEESARDIRRTPCPV